jgi:hypothetical protein
MAGVKKADSPFATASKPPSPISPQDEQKAAKITGLCGTLLEETGFSLVEVGSDYAIYRNRNGHQIAIQGHLWFCKPLDDEEFSGVGFADLENVVRGGKDQFKNLLESRLSRSMPRKIGSAM